MEHGTFRDNFAIKIWFHSSTFSYSYFCLPEGAETDSCCSCVCVYVCVRAMELPNTSICNNGVQFLT